MTTKKDDQCDNFTKTQPQKSDNEHSYCACTKCRKIQVKNNNLWFEDNQDARAAIGLDLIGGIEYTIPDVPINLSLDFKPGFNLVPASFFIYDDIALSVRYVF